MMLDNIAGSARWDGKKAEDDWKERMDDWKMQQGNLGGPEPDEYDPDKSMCVPNLPTLLFEDLFIQIVARLN